jgi:signal transduction histidine kinase
VIIAAALAAVGLARRLTKPLADVGRDAERIGDGDFTIAARSTGIPEIDQVGAALTRTASRLSDLVAREQAFSADASHQLRSPLAALRVTLEAELAHPRSDPVVALNEALADVERLERTIEDLLALARDTGQERPPIEVAEVFDELALRWNGSFAAVRRTLAFDIPPRLPELRVSAAALQHILDVLVDNALRHAFGTVHVSARLTGGSVMIDVTDQGPGVDDAAVAFERRRSAGNGTGIGLSLARRLAEAEGGRLSLVRAAPGATFQLLVPRTRTGELTC